ncbi:MAG: VanZ family protein [Deltaproteobacteria bacterium]|nr:MAG: VanZ family protein [Deltaproteobacteria bacterium]
MRSKAKLELVLSPCHFTYMRSELKFKFIWWGLCHLTAFLILVVCLIPTSGKTPIYPHLDKFFHFFGHGILAYLYTQIWNPNKLTSLFISLFIYGFLIEILQFLTGWRTFDLYDVLGNSFGALYGIFWGLSLGQGLFVKLEKVIRK